MIVTSTGRGERVSVVAIFGPIVERDAERGVLRVIEELSSGRRLRARRLRREFPIERMLQDLAWIGLARIDQHGEAVFMFERWTHT